MVKNEGIFMSFWLSHYKRWFEFNDMYVHSDGSNDETESLVRHAGAHFNDVPRGTIPVGKNNVYIKQVITDLLQYYDCVLFAESPDDILVPGPWHDVNLRFYIEDFLASQDRYRFLTGINITQDENEPLYDPRKGTLLSQRQFAVRCPQYDNAFLWKEPPLWGKGWHDLGGKRLEGMSDKQGEEKRLYNLHIHYADYDLCNRRHLLRMTTYTPEQQSFYSTKINDDLRKAMQGMISQPEMWFSNGRITTIEPWMKGVI